MRRGAKHSIDRVASTGITGTTGAVDGVDQRTLVVGASVSTGTGAGGVVAVETCRWCANSPITYAFRAVGSGAVRLRAKWTGGAEATLGGGALGRRGGS